MNLRNMVEGKELAALKSSIKRIFFYRICGTGMGACACLAKEAGLEVAGADRVFSPPMSTYLKTLNIPLYDLENLSAKNLEEYDLIVVGNSVPRGSKFAEFIEESGKKFTSFPSFLGEFLLKEKEVIGVCGTHGKTTTSYFLTQMLENLGEQPGYFIGGIIDGRPPSKLGEGKFFVIESDEYDSAYFQKISKFRLYELNHMILTSLEYDHADIFSSIEDIKNEFVAMIPNLGGQIVANDSYDAIFDLKNKFNDKSWLLYGENSDIGPKGIKSCETQTQFQLQLAGKEIDFTTNIIGLHNILNISSSVMLLSQLGHKATDLQRAVAHLDMVKRRQEERGYYRGSLVIDDFAHHPKAITLTIDAIRDKYPQKEIITVFEPISATARSDIFQSEFQQSLSKSDQVILAETPLQTTVKGHNNLDCSKIVDDLNQQGVRASLVQGLDELMAKINDVSDDSRLLLVLSNRTCLGLWESRFVEDLK